jgi:hypothetical protein
VGSVIIILTISLAEKSEKIGFMSAVCRLLVFQNFSLKKYRKYTEKRWKKFMEKSYHKYCINGGHNKTIIAM